MVPIRVKISWPESCDPFPVHQSPTYILNDYEFKLDCECGRYDYWVVFDYYDKYQSAIVPRENVIFIAAEPKTVRRYPYRYLKQFYAVVTTQEKLRHKNVIRTKDILPYFVKKSYDELYSMKPFTKDKLISLITSNKRFTKGHDDRYNFSMKIKQFFGDRIEHYGRGINDFDDKWSVLAPFKYSIAIENFSSRDYITEKLDDCFLSYTFPFYAGSPNVEDYYPKGSFEIIDITDVDSSIEIIERILNDSTHYEKHLSALCDARKLYLERYSFFPMITNTLYSLHGSIQNQSVPEFIKIYPPKIDLFNYMLGLKFRLSDRFRNKIITRK